MVSESSAFLWVGNHPALDFVNTELIRNGTRTDLLGDFEQLVDWLAAARLLTGVTPAEVSSRFRHADERSAVLERARRLRTALRTLVGQRVSGQRAGRAALAIVNEVLRLDAGHAQLASTDTGIERRFERVLREPMQLLQPLAGAAADLLCDADPALIKPCANHRCVLFFYDTTKNHARRWCSMELCGNRTKVAAHRRRRGQRDSE